MEMIIVALWFLGGIGLLVVDASHRARHPFSVRLLVIALWPFLVVITVVMWSFQVVSSKRVR